MKERTTLLFSEFFKENAALLNCKKEIEDAFNILLEAYKNGKKMMCCGNGGSAADCEHTVGELMKGFRLKRCLKESDKKRFDGLENGEYISSNLQGTLRAVSLVSQSALMTAYINDVKSDLVFAQQVWGYGDAGDVLLAFSTSGNSENVYNAAVTAKALGCKTVSVTGKDGGRLKAESDVCIILPSFDTARIQEYTLPVYHVLCAALESEFFDI